MPATVYASVTIINAGNIQVSRLHNSDGGNYVRIMVLDPHGTPVTSIGVAGLSDAVIDRLRTEPVLAPEPEPVG